MQVGRTFLIAVGAVALVGLTLLAWQRWWLANFHVVAPDALYRSAGPTDAQLARWIDEYGLRSVLNLRDDRSFHEEAQIVRAHGAVYLHRPFSDRELPDRQAFLALVDTLPTLPLPLLVHCRAGADRAGVLCAVAGMALLDWSYEQAMGQLNQRFLHVGSSEDAIEGVLLRYGRYADAHGRPTGGFAEFRAWLQEHYMHGPYLIAIDAPDTLRVPRETLQPVAVTIHNRTDMTIPCGDPSRLFRLAAYSGSAVDLVPDREYGPRTEVTRDIAPYDSVAVEARFWTPREPGVYELRFDLIEEDVTWFAAQGSPEPKHVMIVH